jgi:DNA-binding protein H-NS
MIKINLEKLSLDELKTLQKDVAKAIAQFEARKRKEALDAIEAVAREKGYSLSELTGTTPSKRSQTQAPPKYKHPENAAKTWSGRGRQPAWVKEHLGAGKDLNELLIDG